MSQNIPFFIFVLFPTDIFQRKTLTVLLVLVTYFGLKRRQAWMLLGTVQLDLIQEVTRYLNMSFLVSTREQFKKINQ